MARIYYATCPRCSVWTAVDAKDTHRKRLRCFGCNAEFPVEDEFLKTLDEIVEEDEKSGEGARA
jgi:hypothetical protein